MRTCANLLGKQQVTVISRDGGKWWSKDHHLVVVKILKNVDFSLKNVKKWCKKVIIFFVKL